MQPTLSLFELARVMGTSTEMIDEHYGHLARNSHVSILAWLNTPADRSGVYLARGVPGPTPTSRRFWLWERDYTRSGRRVSNPRPSAWEANALPTELRPHNRMV